MVNKLARFGRRAVAIDALNFNRRAHFAVQFRIAVIILIEMAIDAVHAFFQMDIHQMHRHAVALFAVNFLFRRRRRHRRLAAAGYSDRESRRPR